MYTQAHGSGQSVGHGYLVIEETWLWYNDYFATMSYVLDHILLREYNKSKYVLDHTLLREYNKSKSLLVEIF